MPCPQILCWSSQQDTSTEIISIYRPHGMESLNSELSLCHLWMHYWLTYCDSEVADETAAVTVITIHFLKCLLAQDFMYWHCHIKAEHIFAGFD